VSFYSKVDACSQLHVNQLNIASQGFVPTMTGGHFTEEAMVAFLDWYGELFADSLTWFVLIKIVSYPTAMGAVVLAGAVFWASNRVKHLIFLGQAVILLVVLAGLTQSYSVLVHSMLNPDGGGFPREGDWPLVVLAKIPVFAIWFRVAWGVAASDLALFRGGSLWKAMPFMGWAGLYGGAVSYFFWINQWIFV
jgi:hypothetical protein